VRALQQHAAPEVSELELGNIVERAYVARGGTTHIHYLAATPMSRPSVCVPAQYPTTRPLAAGDALVCEISASYWEYTGQLLRTFAVAAEPTLVHGFVGGYLPPVLGTRSRALAPVPEFTFASGMTVVVQPNVVTPDERAGVQTGELLLVTEDGVDRLHSHRRGLLPAPSA
jgi:Xaa-Pro dipeptidase